MVRAVTHPYPGAFVGDGSERLFLWSTEVVEGIGAPAAPGTILAIRPDHGVTVATGNGCLLVRRIQPAGHAEQGADAWAVRTGHRPGHSMMGRP